MGLGLYDSSPERREVPSLSKKKSTHRLTLPKTLSLVITALWL